MIDRYVTRVMSPADIGTAVEWAAAEGWNPGAQDAACFSAQDPNGFIGGYVGDRMVASIRRAMGRELTARCEIGESERGRG